MVHTAKAALLIATETKASAAMGAVFSQEAHASGSVTECDQVLTQ
jgi:hypothetical protein